MNHPDHDLLLMADVISHPDIFGTIARYLLFADAFVQAIPSVYRLPLADQQSIGITTKYMISIPNCNLHITHIVCYMKKCKDTSLVALFKRTKNMYPIADWYLSRYCWWGERSWPRYGLISKLILEWYADNAPDDEMHFALRKIHKLPIDDNLGKIASLCRYRPMISTLTDGKFDRHPREYVDMVREIMSYHEQLQTIDYAYIFGNHTLACTLMRFAKTSEEQEAIRDKIKKHWGY